jgi:hypothetical protein
LKQRRDYDNPEDVIKLAPSQEENTKLNVNSTTVGFWSDSVLVIPIAHLGATGSFQIELSIRLSIKNLNQVNLIYRV